MLCKTEIKGHKGPVSRFQVNAHELFFLSQIFIKLYKVGISCHVKNGLGQRLPCRHALLTIRFLVSRLDLELIFVLSTSTLL